MQYPADFVRAVEEAYPGNEEILRSLKPDSGDKLGYYLDQYLTMVVRPEEIVQLFDEGRERELYDQAKRCTVAAELYEWWGRIAHPDING